MFSSIPAPSPRHELDNLMEEAGDVVFRLNQLGQILFASKRAVTLIASQTPLAGDTLPQLMSLDDQAPLAALLAEVATSSQSRLLEVRIKTPDAEIWHELRVSCYANQ